MPLGCGFGAGSYGDDPFGQTNFARKILLENIPYKYLEDDIQQEYRLTKFIRSLFPHTNEFRNKLDSFPLIRNPELLPKDDVQFLSLLENLNPVLQIVGSTLPFVVAGNQITLVGTSPSETITVSVIAVQNELSRIRIGTAWPFATSIRTSKIRDKSYRFLVVNGSNLITLVPEVFPDIKVGDFIQIGDTKHVVTRTDSSLFRVELFPFPVINTVTVVEGADIVDGETVVINDGINTPVTFEFDKDNSIVTGNIKVPITDSYTREEVRWMLANAINQAPSLKVTAVEVDPNIVFLLCSSLGTLTVTDTVAYPEFSVGVLGRISLTRLSRLNLLSLLAKDIGLADDATKPEEIRRGLVLHAVEYFKTKGTKKGYRVRGALEGMDVKVYNFQAVPCLTGQFTVISVGYVTAVPGVRIADGETITIADASASKTFEFDKDSSITPGNIRIDIDDSMTAECIAQKLNNAINSVGGFNINATVNKRIVNLKNTADGTLGEIAITHTVADPDFTVFGMTVVPEVRTNVPALTKDPMLYVSLSDDAPVDQVTLDCYSHNKYFDSGKPSTGSIIAIPGININEGATFTLSDGENAPTVFEFDKDGIFTLGRIPVVINDGMTADQVAQAIEQAISEVSLSLRITATFIPGTATVYLKNKTSGNTVRNIPITETVIDPGFVVSGMSGGTTGFDDYFPVIFPELLPNFEVSGIFFLFNPGPGNNQVITTTPVDLRVGDVVDFGGGQQRIVTAISGTSPFSEIPSFRMPGATISFDQILIDLSPGGSASRVTRLPDISDVKDFLEVAGFEYKVVQFSMSSFTGSVDFIIKDPALVEKVVVARRRRNRVVTREQALGYCRLPVLKIHAKYSPESIFFSGFEGILKSIDAIEEITPIHVRFEDVQFENEIVIQVLEPQMYFAASSLVEISFSVDNYFDDIPSEVVPTDQSKQVFIET